MASEPVNTLLCNLRVGRATAKGSDAGTASCGKRAAGPSQGGERVESCLCLRSVGSDGRRHRLPQASRRTFQRPPTFALGLALKAANHRPEKFCFVCPSIQRDSWPPVVNSSCGILFRQYLALQSSGRATAKGSDAGTTSCSKRAAGPSQGGERVESCLCLRSVGSDGRRHLLPQASRRTFQRPPTFALAVNTLLCNLRVGRATAKGSDAGTASCGKRAAGPSQGGERVESCLCLQSVGSEHRQNRLLQASRRTFQRPRALFAEQTGCTLGDFISSQTHALG